MITNQRSKKMENSSVPALAWEWVLVLVSRWKYRSTNYSSTFLDGLLCPWYKNEDTEKSGAKVKVLFLVYRAFPQLRIWSAAKMGPHSTSIRDTSWHHDEVQRLASFLFHSNGNRDVGLFASVCISPWNCLIKDPSSLPSGHCTPQCCTPQYWLSSDSLASVLTTNSPQQGCT